MTTRSMQLRTTQALTFVAVLALGVVALAVHNDGVFELDGDVIPFNISPGTPADDWQTLFTCTSGSSDPACVPSGVGTQVRSFVADPAPLSIFTTGGSKDENDISQWRFKDGSVPDKDNLTNAYAAVYFDANGNQRLYFGADRLANNGDAQIGFWFFQNTVKLGSGGSFVDQAGNPATHAVGDILILSNFVQGGGSANIQVLKVTAVNPNGTVTFQSLVSGAAGANVVCNPAAGAIPADSVCAATNGSATESLDPDYTPKSGPTGSYPPVSFFEGGVNLTAIGLGGECFPGFLVETRSSQSIDAVLKDFTLHGLQQCTAGLTTEVHDSAHADITGTTVPANTAVHDKAIVTGTAGFPTPTGSVTFSFFDNGTCAAPAADTEGPVTLGPESATVATAESTPRTPQPGSYSYQVSYSGDGNYPAVPSSACEPFTVSKFDSAVNTRILLGDGVTEVTNQAINLMNNASVAVVDEATVTGAAPPAPTPTGTVTFERFSSGNCSGTATTETVTLDGTGKALSAAFTLGPATLSYRATYNGDDFYNASTVSKCEPVCALNFTSSQP